MKYYVDIILQGKEFNPEEVSNILGIKFRKFHRSGDYNKRLKSNEIEGYGILSSREELTTEEVIEKTISEYEEIYKLGEEKLGIEEKMFHLCVECLQNSFSLKTKYMKKICKYFSEIEITILDE